MRKYSLSVIGLLYSVSICATWITAVARAGEQSANACKN